MASKIERLLGSRQVDPVRLNPTFDVGAFVIGTIRNSIGTAVVAGPEIVQTVVTVTHGEVDTTKLLADPATAASALSLLSALMIAQQEVMTERLHDQSRLERGARFVINNLGGSWPHLFLKVCESAVVPNPSDVTLFATHVLGLATLVGFGRLVVATAKLVEIYRTSRSSVH